MSKLISRVYPGFLAAASFAVAAGCVTIAWDVPSKHKPVAQENCRACHDASGRGVPLLKPLVQVQFPRNQLKTREERRTAQALRRLMRYRSDRLCYQCHTKLNPEKMKEKPAWVHGPYGLGACLVCHHPHESMGPHLLTSYPLVKNCKRCHPTLHKGEALFPEQDRLGKNACSKCHNPHFLPKGSAKFPVTRPKASDD